MTLSETAWAEAPCRSERPATVAAMEPADVPVVAAVERACFATAWEPFAYHNELANPAAVYYVARCCGTVVAFAGMWVAMDEAHFTLVGVVKGHRRLGIATRLVVALLDEAVNRGAVRATLEVRERNEHARRLYERFGFEFAGRRERYYTDTNEAAVIMWAENIGAHELAEQRARIRADLETGVRPAPRREHRSRSSHWSPRAAIGLGAVADRGTETSSSG